MSEICGAVLPVKVGDILTIDTSKSMCMCVPPESQLKVVGVFRQDCESVRLNLDNLTPDNLLPSNLDATLFRGRRGEDGPWFDAIKLINLSFLHVFEVTKIEPT